MFYEPDLSRPAYNHDFSKDASLRLTWQATAKQKLVGSFTRPSVLPVHVSAPGAGESHLRARSCSRAPLRPAAPGTAHYTSPLTDRLLIEADYSKSRYNREQRRIPGVGLDAISVTDTGLNLSTARGARSTSD